MVQSPVELGSSRKSQIWPTTELEPVTSRQSQDKPKKKKGLAKIWRMVTRSGKNDASNIRESQSLDRPDDDADYPLAPPPPLSYLVSRGSPGDRMRHASTPSLPLTAPPKQTLSPTSGIFPSTAPSTSLPSPASSRQSGVDQDTPETRRPSPNGEDTETQISGPGTKNVYSVTSEPDLRQRVNQAVPIVEAPVANQQTVSSRLTISSISRDKSLPPLPNDAVLRPYVNGNARDSSRPRTVYTFDSRPPGTGAPHDFLPPTPEPLKTLWREFDVAYPVITSSCTSDPDARMVGNCWTCCC